LEGFSGSTSAATIGRGSFDHSDNPRTSEDAAIIGNHHHANTNIFRSHHHNPQRLYLPVIRTPTRAFLQVEVALAPENAVAFIAATTTSFFPK